MVVLCHAERHADGLSTETSVSMNKVLTQVLAKVRELWAREPTRVISVTTAVVVFVCAKLGVVVPAESVASAVDFAVPVLLGGEIIRNQISPAAPTAAPKG